MAAKKKCIICLNDVRPKKKTSTCFEEQMHLVFLFKKLVFTPIRDSDFRMYLQFGNPSDWASLCHMCEKEVKKALDVQREINKLLEQIVEIRRNLFDQNFYESDSEDEEDVDGSGFNLSIVADSEEIFSKLRQQLRLDYRQSKVSPRGPVLINYPGAKTNRTDDEECHIPLAEPKLEPVSDADDTSLQEPEETYFNSDYEEQDIHNEFLPSDLKGSKKSKSPRLRKRFRLTLKKKVNSATSSSDDEAEDDDYSPLPSSSNFAIPSIKRTTHDSNQIPLSTELNQSQDSQPVPELDGESFNRTDCPICGKVFVKAQRMRRHYRESHMKLKNFECPECSHKFARREYLVAHIQIKHPNATHMPEETSAQYKCPHCPSKFHIGRALRTHIKTAHKIEDGFWCDECGQRFKRKDYLTGHQKFAHPNGQDLAKQTCPVCKKVFRTAGVMKRHIRESHDKVKEFTCEKCGKEFARKSYLIYHDVHHHPVGETIKMLRCQICKSKCRGQGALSRHLKIVHRTKEPSQCDLCGKSYSHVDALQVHMRSAHNNDGNTSKEEGNEPFENSDDPNATG